MIAAAIRTPRIFSSLPPTARDSPANKDRAWFSGNIDSLTALLLRKKPGNSAQIAPSSLCNLNACTV